MTICAFLLSAVTAVASYFKAYAPECDEAMKFMEENSGKIATEMSVLTPAERVMACAIVAPEVSQLSHVVDYLQLRSLYVLYVYQGTGDFSVGVFQMKPSFMEMVEHAIRGNAALNRKYGKWVRGVYDVGDGRDRRRMRLERLESIEWQLRYLAMFFDLAKIRTAGMTFPDPESRLRYYATLYNSGLMLSPEKVRAYMERTFFPHGVRKYNYADVAVEFYHAMFKGRAKGLR